MATDRRLRGLYAVTPEEPDTARLVERVTACLEGGAALVQYRAKEAAPSRALAQARALAALCRERGVPLIVNDSIDLALAAGADGVHVGREDGSVRDARLAFPRGIVGASCYDDPQLAQAAAREGADYVAIGSVFASSTKPGARRASLELVAEAKRLSGVPVAAIGGITAANARATVDAGADLLAVVSAVFEASDVRAAAQAFAKVFLEATETSSMYDRSRALFERSQQLIPGGVNSPVRAFRAVGGTPVFFREGRGAWLVDEDGRTYVDYVGSWGPLILGHAHPEVLEEIAKVMARGLSFGAPTALELEMAELLTASLPSLEQVRLVSSGTEAVMSALRLARGFTGRKVIVKFEGCYHGHSDFLLVKAGSGALTFGNPTSAGVPEELTRHTLVLDYNDPQQVRDAFAKFGADIAAVVLEPIAGNMNFVRPSETFIRELEQQCRSHGALLIFDEVMTGFRVGPQGAQGLFGVKPDLTTLGKVIGGGMPVGAFGGRRDVMQKLAPVGPVYQAGTLSGNPVAVTAGLATLRRVLRPGFHEQLGSVAARLVEGLEAAAREASVPFCGASAGGMFGLFFRATPPASFREVMESDREAFNRFFHAMLARGVYLAPSAYEAGFVSSAHGEAELEATFAAAREAFLLARH